MAASSSANPSPWASAWSANKVMLPPDMHSEAIPSACSAPKPWRNSSHRPSTWSTSSAQAMPCCSATSRTRR
ncbi:Uncharacterised protein [Bordetella pertussis]|nr:Uncharacterised protein [Bordetella pertussis]CFP59621.1 Uncharacterised protein [Bordetella pertussis]CFW49462.1 Uncharacterised protein [Bordetella pertussis]